MNGMWTTTDNVMKYVTFYGGENRFYAACLINAVSILVFPNIGKCISWGPLLLSSCV